ncbi:MAG TPA: Sua5/YciO/YrdC/YwlC family protein, partial [Gemmatimonadales bacterium]|nr:Sua5/YciO/YrdC/YwlC family protein [Gemmatimonadales bacterium]
PIILLRTRSANRLAKGVAPGLDTIGVMLPSTPLHALLLDRVQGPLVMTSGNRSEEPIAAANSEARIALGGIADGFLLHNREIACRCDDSVLRMSEGLPVFLRRARGYAPLPISLPVPSPVPLVAVGPHLKNTFTLVQGGQAFVSPHVGDLESLETLEQFHRSLNHLAQLFRVSPCVAVHDLHPGYLSTRIAREMGLSRLIAVQHHHAHIAAVLAEHGEEGPVLGVAFDGTGFGDDGAVWGGELFLADLLGYKRVGHLRYVPLPGGDLATRAPWRVALGYASLEPHLAPALESAFQGVDPRERGAAEWQIETAVNTPHASSMGRLFDAAAAILGVRRLAEYEGQAAMELEALAGCRIAAEYYCGLEEAPDGSIILDPMPLLVRLGLSRQRGQDPADLAADFHASIAWNTTQWVVRAAGRVGADTVALGGGVFQNARLFASLQRRLQSAGLRVLTPRKLSPNDGAISYGQAAVAAARLAREAA